MEVLQLQLLQYFCFWQEISYFGKNTSYDKEELDSKKDKTYEKYHSGWGDDYEEFGNRKNTKEDEEFRNAARKGELSNYYEVLGISRDASQEEIKNKFRRACKKDTSR